MSYQRSSTLRKIGPDYIKLKTQQKGDKEESVPTMFIILSQKNYYICIYALLHCVNVNKYISSGL